MFLRSRSSVDSPEAEERIRDLEAKLAAIDRSQAVIEFDMTGHILSANANFLTTMAIRPTR